MRWSDFMNFKRYILMAAFVLPLAGCASRDYQGGTYDDTVFQTSGGVSNADPAGSPTFRPGMHSEDPRDPHFTTRPQSVSPPITSP